jgi:hypothetical protein
MAAFDHFTRFMIAAARADLAHVIDGGIETDAAVFVCDGLAPALRIARRAFLRAFATPQGRFKERRWLRGAVVPGDGSVLRTERAAHGPGSKVKIYTYSRAFFDAVAVEKSGFRGMRLLVRGGLVTSVERNSLAIPVGARAFVPLKRLRHSTYPSGPADDLQDYLWMGTNEPEEWRRLHRQMSTRLRESTLDSEEFVQAAATQVLFHEAMAVFQSVSSNDKRMRKAS